MRRLRLTWVLLFVGMLCLGQQPQAYWQSRSQVAVAGATEGTVLIDTIAISSPGTNGVQSQTFINGSVGSGGFTLNLGSGPNGTTNRALGIAMLFCGTTGGVSSGPSLAWHSNSMGLPIGSLSGGAAGDIYFFGQVNPDLGANDVTASWTGPNQVVIALLSVVGADQTGGATTFTGFTSLTGTSSVATVNVTAPSTRISMGAFTSPNSNFTTPGAGNTDIGHVDTCNINAIAANYDTGHTNPSLSYSPSEAAWGAMGVSIKGI